MHKVEIAGDQIFLDGIPLESVTRYRITRMAAAPDRGRTLLCVEMQVLEAELRLDNRGNDTLSNLPESG